MSWLDLLIEATDFVETPKQWIYWSGLCTISAIASPNVRINKQGAYLLAPNLYVLLVGRSGLGKGFGPSVSRKLVKMVNNTRVISGRGTIEGIISELARVKADANGHIPFKDSRGYICSGEFASTLYEAKHALTILTDLYDSHANPEWENTLKNSPVEKLTRPCITLLSGANQDMFDMTVDKRHMGGGFIGRTLLIPAEKRYRSNAMIDEDAPDVNYEMLSRHLKELAQIPPNSIMKWDKQAKEVYNAWFYPYREKEHDDKTGTMDRLNDHIIKIATCIALARSTELMLRPVDVEKAIEVSTNLSFTARKVAGMQGKSSISSHLKSFLTIMFTSDDYELTRAQILTKGFGDFSSEDLDQVVNTLAQTQFVETFKSSSDEVKYRLTQTAISWWESKSGKES